MNNSIRIKRLVGIASLAAVVIVLQLIASYIPFTKIFGGTISITLALIPVVVGAILYGPKGGLILGLVLGFMNIIDPSTMAIFMPHNAIATIILCFLKTGAAGLISGLLFKLTYKKSLALAIVLASIFCPIINTGIFTLGAALFFSEIYGATVGDVWIIFGIIWLNFIVEFAVNSILSPVVLSISRVAYKNHSIGCVFDLEEE